MEGEGDVGEKVWWNGWWEEEEQVGIERINRYEFNVGPIKTFCAFLRIISCFFVFGVFALRCTRIKKSMAWASVGFVCSFDPLQIHCSQLHIFYRVIWHVFQCSEHRRAQVVVRRIFGEPM